MNRTRRCGRRQCRPSRLLAVIKSTKAARWIFLLLVAGSVAWLPGCANHRLLDLYRGKSCSSKNVQRYASEHNLTYKEALDEIRNEDARLWEQQEALRAQELKKQKASDSKKTSNDLSGHVIADGPVSPDQQQAY